MNDNVLCYLLLCVEIEMPERRICSFTHEEIEPGTGMMYIKRDGSVFWFKDSKARKNMLKLKRNPRRLKWTRRYEKGGIK